MKTYHSKYYKSEVKLDYYGTKIFVGDLFMVFYDTNNLVNVDNLYEYLYDFYKDAEVQMIDEDRELYEYIKNKYDADVYKNE